MRTPIEPEVQPTNPKDEPLRPVPEPTFAEFLQRTRRYHQLTKRAGKMHYARGLDTRPEDMA